MDEFLQAELEAGQTETAGHGEKPTEEPHKKCSRGIVAKRTRVWSIEAGLSQKKMRREPMDEAPFKETSTSGVEPEPVHAGSEEDEDSKILLHLRSHLTRGLAIVTVEELLEETAERQGLEVNHWRLQCPLVLSSQALFRVERKLLTQTFYWIPRLR